MSGTTLCLATRRAKVRYDSKESAEAALEDVRIVRSHGRARGKIESTTYHCRSCQGWHLTSRK